MIKYMQKQVRARAWVIWLLSSLFMFYKYALEVSPSVMAPTLMGAFGISGAELGNLAATYFYSYLLLQIPAGLLIDKLGPRIATTAAIVMCAVGSLIFAGADSLLAASIGRFLTGIGAAFAAISCLKLIANWFSTKKFALMAGLMMTVAMLGAVGGQAPLSAFIDALDWRSAMHILGIAGIVLAIIFWFIVRDVAPYHRTEEHHHIPLMKNLKRLLKTPQAWWLSAYSGFAFAPVMIFGGLWGVSFTQQALQFTANEAAQAVSLIFIGFAFGAPFFGWFSDWLDKRRVVMFWGTFLALLLLSAAIYLPVHPLLFAILLLLFGFFISSFLLCFTMISEISTAAMAATAVGFMNAFDALIGAFSDPLTGKFLDLHWDGALLNGARIFSLEAYQLSFITIPVYLILSLLFLLRIKETRHKPSLPTSLP